ncbi:hypothetical protein R6Q57_024472 [Mikania cordata]
MKHRMIGTKNFIKIARKSQEMATIRRKSIAANRTFQDNNNNTTTKIEKGHFVAYTLDGHRFVLPIGHLKSYIFRELLTISEEEFGLPRSGPITFPSDVAFIKDAANLIHKRATLASERALLQSLITKCNYPCFDVDQERTRPQIVAHSC